jgi:hypothetical protein
MNWRKHQTKKNKKKAEATCVEDVIAALRGRVQREGALSLSSPLEKLISFRLEACGSEPTVVIVEDRLLWKSGHDILTVRIFGGWSDRADFEEGYVPSADELNPTPSRELAWDIVEQSFKDANLSPNSFCLEIDGWQWG